MIAVQDRLDCPYLRQYNPYRTLGRKISDPASHFHTPHQLSKGGLTSHLNNSRSRGPAVPFFLLILSFSSWRSFMPNLEKFGKGFPRKFDFQGTKGQGGGHGDPPFGNGHGGHSGRRSAPRGPDKLMSTCGEGSQGGNPSTRRPGRGSPLALASCGRAPRVGVRGVCQGSRHPHCRLSHERSEAGDSRRVGRFDARAVREEL